MKAAASVSASSSPPPDGSPTPAPRQRPTRVLLTNDDGPHSPFFSAWVEHVRHTLSWRAFVAPPAEGQSFVSKAVATGSNHASSGRGRSDGASRSAGGIFVTRVDEETVHVSGPPATAVNLSLHHLATDCDLVVSGPNVGHNVGRGSVLSSGTVGAALEGAVAGRRAVALSFPFKNGYGNWSDEELRRAVEASGQVVRWLWENWGEGVDFYNVNVPLDFARESDGGGAGGAAGVEGATETATTIPLSSPHCRFVTTTVDPRAQYSSLYAPAHPDAEHDYEWGPSGLKVFDPATAPPSGAPRGVPFHPGGDVEAVSRGHISVTPLRAGLAHAEPSMSLSREEGTKGNGEGM